MQPKTIAVQLEDIDGNKLTIRECPENPDMIELVIDGSAFAFDAGDDAAAVISAIQDMC